MTIMFDSKSNVTLIDHMGGDGSVAMSAWVSFGNDQEERLKDEGRVKGLINFLLRERHMTPFESSIFTFRVETPIFVAREFFRHRSASYSEISGRYTVLPYKFYIPDNDRPLKQIGKPGQYRFVEGEYAQIKMVQASTKRVCTEAISEYERMLNFGVAKEVARNVLPVSTYTQFYVTMNARNLMHFLELRTAPDALHEIREVAGSMESIFADLMPLTHAAYSNHVKGDYDLHAPAN